MVSQLYEARREGNPPRWFVIREEHLDDRWVSTCAESDHKGREWPGAFAVAPKFYGVTAEQAHRRMVDALERSYDEVTPVRGGAEA